MRAITVLASSLVLVLLVVGVFAGALAAQQAPQKEVLPACAPGKERIVADDLPRGAGEALG